MENLVFIKGDVKTVNKRENLIVLSKAYYASNSLLYMELYDLLTFLLPYCYYYYLYIYYIGIYYNEVI